jgi:hypothetical protein
MEDAMAYIVEQKVGSHAYLYESVSYRDEQGRPRSRRKIIGKIDKNGSPVYKDDYMKKLASEGKPLPPPSSYTVEHIQSSTISELGAFHFFTHIGIKTGLSGILQDVFPDIHREIFDLACFLVASGDPMMYCDDWLSKTDAFPASLSSPRISELLRKIECRRRNDFFQSWGEYRREREYLALDITSVSSYSKLIHDAEFGYNRDRERLAQVNLCLLLGESSRLPVFQMEYSGSLKDVSTLKSTLETCCRLGKNKLRLVMDKGFYSEKNLLDLIKGPEKHGFIMAVPFTARLAREAVEERREVLGNPGHAIAWDKHRLQGICGEREIGGHTMFVHVYYNMVKEAESKSNICGYAASLAELAENNPLDKKYREEFDRYLTITRSEKTGRYRITLKKQNIKAEYSHDGWMVLISNHCKSSKEALEIYRAKDVVEKGFFRLKNDLDLRRLRVHRDETMDGKIFIGFISLILLSYIHKGMTEKDMYKDVTMKEMIRHLEKLKVQTIMGKRIVYPLTKMQKRIFDNFDIPYPV